jgi:hypothetical protein
VPNTPRETARNVRRHRFVACAFVIAALALSTNVAGAKDLQWRRGGPNANHVIPTAPIHRDIAVAPVVYQNEQASAGPNFGNEPVSQAALRSVVVHHDDQPEDDNDMSFRSAQRYGEPASPPADSHIEQQLRSPFGDSTPQNGNAPQTLKEETMPLPPVEGAPSELFPPNDNGPNMPESQTPPPSLPQNQQPTKQRQQNNAETPPRTFTPQRPAQTAHPRAGSQGPSDNGPPTGNGPTQESPLGIAGGSHLEPEVLQAEQGKARQFCSEELAKEKASTLNDVSLAIDVPGTQGEDFPFECSIDDGTMYNGRCWDQITYMWKASCLCHKPLYFEDEQLERYGHSWGPCCDPLVSGAHFFCTLPVLPYCMGVNPPGECMYALGHYRPGNCAPYMINPVPLSCRGAAAETGAVAGAIWFLP